MAKYPDEEISNVGFTVHTQFWAMFDTRTNERVGVFSSFDKELADRQLEWWKDEDERGGKPEFAEDLPFLEVRAIEIKDDEPPVEEEPEA